MTTTLDIRIEELFCQGHPLDHIVTIGTDVGWSYDDVMAVLRDKQWDLDPSGRLPRSKRVTTPRGLRGRPPAPTPSPAAKATPRPRKETASTPPPPPVPAPAPARRAPAATPRPAATPPVAETPAAAPKRRGRPPQPIQHGSAKGFYQHRKRGELVPEDDPCGCRAAYRVEHAAEQRASYRRKHPKTEPAPPAPEPPTPARLPCVVKPIMEPRTPINPAQSARPTVAEAVPDLVIDAGTTTTKPARAQDPPDPGREPARPSTPTDVDHWLAAAQRSPRPAVRRHAAIALLALLRLRCALDDLARAERSTTA